MKDILLSAVFMLNMGFIVLFAIDFLKRYKTNESSGKNVEADENSKDVTEHEPTSAPVRKAGVGKSKFSMGSTWGSHLGCQTPQRLVCIGESVDYRS